MHLVSFGLEVDSNNKDLLKYKIITLMKYLGKLQWTLLYITNSKRLLLIHTYRTLIIYKKYESLVLR